MGWRIVYIQEAIRLNYKLNSLGVMYKEEVIWINIDEIDSIVIEDQYCNISVKLISELSKKGINVIICSDNHTPIGIITSICNNQRAAKYNRIQIEWTRDVKQKMWTNIIKHKILLQIVCLYKMNKKQKIDILKKYFDEVELGDITNREGLAAKVYFKELFGSEFIRTRNAEDVYNSALNFAYQVVRSKISQEIVAHGYIPSLGIFHCSEYNYFGLADDLIEVYRPIIDYYVIKLLEEEQIKLLTPFIKNKILNLLYEYVLFYNTKRKLIESIKLYVINIIDSISNCELENVEFPYFYDEN